MSECVSKSGQEGCPATPTCPAQVASLGMRRLPRLETGRLRREILQPPFARPARPPSEAPDAPAAPPEDDDDDDDDEAAFALRLLGARRVTAGFAFDFFPFVLVFGSALRLGWVLDLLADFVAFVTGCGFGCDFESACRRADDSRARFLLAGPPGLAAARAATRSSSSVSMALVGE